jgi:hypothetical protein
VVRLRDLDIAIQFSLVAEHISNEI